MLFSRDRFLDMIGQSGSGGTVTSSPVGHAEPKSTVTQIGEPNS